MTNLDEVLIICCKCKKIRIPSSTPENPMWLDPNLEGHKELYQRYICLYNSKLSHGLCPPCGAKSGAELDKLEPIVYDSSADQPNS